VTTPLIANFVLHTNSVGLGLLTSTTAIGSLVAALSRAALALREQVQEFELNPVIVHADGSGLTVADALLTRKPL
jgi:hypothetical protein